MNSTNAWKTNSQHVLGFLISQLQGLGNWLSYTSTMRVSTLAKDFGVVGVDTSSSFRGPRYFQGMRSDAMVERQMQPTQSSRGNTWSEFNRVKVHKGNPSRPPYFYLKNHLNRPILNSDLFYLYMLFNDIMWMQILMNSCNRQIYTHSIWLHDYIYIYKHTRARTHIFIYYYNMIKLCIIIIY